jgi:hypothetical protein
MNIETAKKISDFWCTHKEEGGKILFHFLIGKMNGNRERHTRIRVEKYNDFIENKEYFTKGLTKKQIEAADFIIKEFFKL